MVRPLSPSKRLRRLTASSLGFTGAQSPFARAPGPSRAATRPNGLKVEPASTWSWVTAFWARLPSPPKMALTAPVLGSIEVMAACVPLGHCLRGPSTSLTAFMPAAIIFLSKVVVMRRPPLSISSSV
jgi:hypothetical protein